VIGCVNGCVNGVIGCSASRLVGVRGVIGDDIFLMWEAVGVRVEWVSR
jgi:hypothetical protein